MPKWLQYKAQADDSLDEIMIYGEIGDAWDDLSARNLANKLKASKSDTVTVRINSGGGSVFTATAFHSLLVSSGKTINVVIDGLAASAATIIACAGTKVTMPVNALYMIHNPLVVLFGNAKEMREKADVLDKVRDTIVATYQQKTDLSAEKIIEMMDAETWLSAEEALELGFVDEIMETANIAATTKAVIEMSSNTLKNIPESFKNAVKSANEQPKEVVKPMDLAKFKADHSAIAEQFKAELSANHQDEIKNSVLAERKRITDIQNAALQGQDDLVKDAIENGLSAGEFAIKALNQTKSKGAEFLANRAKESEVLSKIDTPTPSNKDDAPQTAEDKLVAALGKEFEVK
ncbi:MAG: hypothetical protein [Caudoviricetes sp.]|nr:MAG: hypothetical protein [Caudoviricetes sp.]